MTVFAIVMRQGVRGTHATRHRSIPGTCQQLTFVFLRDLIAHPPRRFPCHATFTVCTQRTHTRRYDHAVMRMLKPIFLRLHRQTCATNTNLRQNTGRRRKTELTILAAAPRG